MKHLKPFTKSDWYAYMGCESETPHICYLTEDIAVLVDGKLATVQYDDEFDTFQAKEFDTNQEALVVADVLCDVFHQLGKSSFVSLASSSLSPRQ